MEPEDYDLQSDDGEGELDIRGNEAGGGAEGDFTDGSRASGLGRGDPGRDDEEFTRLQSENDRLTQRSRILDDFERDPERVLRETAQRMGLDLVPRGGQQGRRDEPDDRPPREFVERISRTLPPEMQFMADSLAQASWVANQEALRPYQQQQAESRLRDRNYERDGIVAEMDRDFPEWRRALGDMEEQAKFIVDAMNGGPMRHPKFGTLQGLLYKLVAGDGASTKRVVNRMRSAARNASSVSEGGQDSGADIGKQLRGEKDQNKRWRMAFRDALTQHVR